MSSFRLGNLDDWVSLDAGTVMAFDVTDPPTAISIRALASGLVDFYVSVAEGDGQLVASGEGNVAIRFTALDSFELSAVRPEGSNAEVWIKGRREPQVMPPPEVPSFATIQPRGVQPADNVRRMMHMMAINNRRRDLALRAELERLGARLEAQAELSAAGASGGAPAPEAAQDAVEAP